MHEQAKSAKDEDEIRVYWQTGCTACLRTKEFLTRHGVPFVSRNVLADAGALDELTRFGIRQVPIVTRGDQWANGQVLADVARVVGIDLAPQPMLTPAQLASRIDTILDGALRFVAQLPEGTLDRQLPNRPRSYAALGYHIFNIVDCLLEHDAGIGLTYAAYDRVPPPDMKTKADLLAYGRDVRARIARWFEQKGRTVDWQARADVYYGVQSLHQFLERTTWHSGQHTRQLMWVLETQLAIVPDRKLGSDVFAGLPLPRQVWDDADVEAKST